MSSAHFSQLEAFLAVARMQSFSGAARELGVSRSAVSQSVRQLEEELRVTLVARTTRSVSLTDAGRRLLESAGPAVAQVHAALSGMTETPGEVVGRVRLTVPRSAFHFVIEPVLPKFRERHPRIEVELVFEDRRVDIVREGFDAGIRLSEFVERDMVSVRLTRSVSVRGGRCARLPGQAWRSRAPRGPQSPRMPDVSLGNQRLSVCVGARAGPPHVARGGSGRPDRQRWPVLRGMG